jgi:hypothetical protein
LDHGINVVEIPKAAPDDQSSSRRLRRNAECGGERDYVAQVVGGQGIALMIHDELLRDRPEAQVSLLVNALNGVCGLMSRFSVPLRRSFATFLVAAPHPCAHAARRRAGSMAIGQDAEPARS